MNEHVHTSGAVRDRTAEPDPPPVRDVRAEADYSRCGAVIFGCRENPSLH